MVDVGKGEFWGRKIRGGRGGRLNIKGMSQKLKLASGPNELSVNFPR